MPVSEPTRRPRRRLAVVAAATALIGAALGAPSSASAYQEHFCQFATMPSGTNCYAPVRHTLQNVQGHTIGSTDRICAASFHVPFGAQNSDWRCDYGYVLKLLGGRVDGVGAIRNGDPQLFYGYGVQEF
jgi:hypothetical protein